MRIAVTGSAGRVGKNVVRELLAHGHEAVGLSIVPSGESAIPQIAVDIRDFSQVYNALDGCEAVIHLAANPGPFERKPSEVLTTNTIGTNNVLQAALQRNIKRIAQASSDSAFGFVFAQKRPLPDYLPLDEQHPDKPQDYYALSKIFNERICDALAARNPGVSLMSLRISLVIQPDGYGHRWTKPMRTDPENGSWNMWSFIDARDVARAFRLAVEKGPVGHEKILIAASRTRVLVPTMDLVRKYYPEVTLKRELNGYESLLDCSKAQTLLGFTPQYDWDDAQ